MINYFRKLFGEIVNSDSSVKYAVDNSHHEVFQYEYIKSYVNNNDYFEMCFYKIEAVDYLIARLLLIFKQLGFEEGRLIPELQNHEITIHANTPNGEIVITRDIYDFVSISMKDKKINLDLLDQAMNVSDDFKRIDDVGK